MSESTKSVPKVEEEEGASSSPSDRSSATSGPGASIATGIDVITSFIQEKLKISNKPSVHQKKQILVEPTIQAVCDYIKSGRCKNIITMVGAGISTAAGIPDFRSPGSGLYANLQKYNLPHPEAIFFLDYFHHNAKPFFSLAKELYPGSFKPTKSHYFIKLLEEKQLLLRHYTQNIDTLERISGLSSDKLVEAHGTFHSGHCLGCRKEYTQEWMKIRIFQDEIPICEDCPGVVKPDIVFFGEDLPLRFYKCMKTDFKNCDLLIIMGSSLCVQPFASLVDRVSRYTPRLLINKEEVGDSLEFHDEHNTRDVLMLGDCDDQCQILAEKLGWSEELNELMKTEHAKVDCSNSTK
ncbi:NAD-dependent protein deacetylase sirtuin-2 [Atheta coriaria]|uniref:NAD-dependent protein deacetylase sirtuin-2 n=1 Tax=Dalotia coriaria TaxID=877792 RepID=UPI0031F356D8